MSTPQSPQYWLFQASPGVFRLRAALRLGVLHSFAVTSHKDKIKAGDQVILWQSGKGAACYGLATVLEPPSDRPPSAQELPFFKVEPGNAPRVLLSVDYNLWSQPLEWELLKEHGAFEGLNAGLPGTNFTATRKQYEALINLIQQQDMVNEPGIPYLRASTTTFPLNQILFGPPGTGKTYLTVNHALAIIEGRTLEELSLESRQELRERYNQLLEQNRIGFVTFHQSFSYEDFVEGIKPEAKGGQVDYRVEEGLFKNISDTAMEALKAFAYQLVTEGGNHEFSEEGWPDTLPLLPSHLLDESPKYVLIIDEINRGNVPSIFGELITLLEPDKRAGREESITLKLPYSKHTFSVPPNLFIIATMNTTDRSTEVLDVALRRRFAFKPVPVSPKLLTQINEPMAAGINLEKMLETINKRIQLLLGRDYAIGHAYLLGVHDLARLKRAFAQHIIPLLEEYFFNDYGKIGLILGQEFVIEVSFPSGSDAFAHFDHPYAGEFAERKVYELRPLAELTEAAFIRIYDKNY